MVDFVTAAGLLIAALLAIPVARARTGDYFPPAALIVAVWCGTLGLYALRLLPYVPLRSGTIQLLAGTIVLLAGGSVLGMRLARDTQTTTKANADTRANSHASAPAAQVPSAEPGSAAATSASAFASQSAARRFAQSSGWARWTTSYALAGLAGTVWYVAQVVALLGWDGFRNGEILRAVLHEQRIPSTFLFLQFFSLAAAMLAYALWQAGRLRARHLLLPALGSLGTLITTDRTQTFTLLVTIFFIATFHLGPRLKPRLFAAAALLVPVALVGNFILIGLWRGSSWDTFQRQVAAAAPHANAIVWQGLAKPLAMPYFYATSSYPALDYVLHAPPPPTGGLMTIYPISRALERLRILEGPLPEYIPPFVPVTPAAPDAAPLQTNAPTFLSYALQDFGPGGALIYAFAVGVVCGLAWSWARRDRSSAARLLVVGQMSTALLLTIFVNKFNNTASWYVFLLTLVPFFVAVAHRRHTVAALPSEKA